MPLENTQTDAKIGKFSRLRRAQFVTDPVKSRGGTARREGTAGLMYPDIPTPHVIIIPVSTFIIIPPVVSTHASVFINEFLRRQWFFGGGFETTGGKYRSKPENTTSVLS